MMARKDDGTEHRLPPGLYRRGNRYWIKYYINGRAIRESTRTDKLSEAKRMLDERKGRAAIGLATPRRVDRIRYDEIAADLLRHYQTTGCRDETDAKGRLKRLLPFFTQRRAMDIDGSLVSRYVEMRQGQNASNGTVNRELEVLSKMLKLAYEHSKLLRVPIIHMLKEADPRQGFFEPTQFDAVRRQLRPDLQVAATIAYTFGWRMQSEVLTLTLSRVDLETGLLRLDPGTTKMTMLGGVSYPGAAGDGDRTSRPGEAAVASAQPHCAVSLPTLRRTLGGDPAAGFSAVVADGVPEGGRGWDAPSRYAPERRAQSRQRGCV